MSRPAELYVPVTEAHLVSKIVGAGKARPQLSTLGDALAKAKAQAERAVRDVATELLAFRPRAIAGRPSLCAGQYVAA